ncbi:dTMP kinase [Pseudoclavibacter sp. RFBJ3]|uniref:dTMP kinase n=1 Tax=unclassified Pseudoclavibacter TaxID=2615177 RepID=UPI000CE84F4D|nr:MULTISPECIES: dTMP kinase [unclassified Pseudoclavibacter]PPF82580.1 dTMP kinase [Pseudoclavibacter sp. RFBJ5]PPF91474.1 dTMP kinase [Pseudoclavibacter sp. RFBJ3]PPF96398.1 dTMP kinase [Pseudoclavibacter sp. RFBH5]PPG22144.1 dTMP kinase [Pseudoclavibacter sp. RFBI4]
MTGLFITLEGGDGAGKSTHSGLLENWLNSLGQQVVRTREPGGTDLGADIRELVLHRKGHMDARAEALLYAADRAQHIATVVRPALERGDIVVQDRYLDSSIAYQGTGRELGADEVRDLSLWAARGLLPDLTVLFDLDPEEGRRRIGETRGTYDRLEAESKAFHDSVRSAFLALAAADPDRFLVIDATQPREHVAELIRTRVAELLERQSASE